MIIIFLNKAYLIPIKRKHIIKNLILTSCNYEVGGRVLIRLYLGTLDLGSQTTLYLYFCNNS